MKSRQDNEKGKTNTTTHLEITQQSGLGILQLASRPVAEEEEEEVGSWTN